MKKILLLIICLLMLTGCQPNKNKRVELNQNAGQILPISALAIDKKDNLYQMTIESIRQDSLDGEVSPAYFTVKSENFSDLFYNADMMLASRLYLSHASIIIVSEDIARFDIDNLVNSLLERPDARLTLRIAIAENSTPDEILQAPSVTDGIPGMALSSLLEKRTKDQTFLDFPMFRILDYRLNGRDIALPVLTLSDDGHVKPKSSIIISNDGGVKYA